MFDPPAACVQVEIRAPGSPEKLTHFTLPGLIDSGADITAIPQEVVSGLNLFKVDEIRVGDYDDAENAVIKEVYSAKLTIVPIKPIIARVIPKKTEEYMIIGRDVINEWLLTLDGPNLKAFLKITST